jgi:PIN domain nuclease of toxin-antitoxin system
VNLLLDTHILLWAAAGTLPEKAENIVANVDNELYFSPVSLWEIGIKNNLGRSGFRIDPSMLRRGLLNNHYQELPITGLHALAVNDLPMLHKDPFDRMLLAQARCEGLFLLTSDGVLRKYRGMVMYIPKI